jgi:hypothetical protein
MYAAAAATAAAALPSSAVELKPKCTVAGGLSATASSRATASCSPSAYAMSTWVLASAIALTASSRLSGLLASPLSP